jgi:hypothetical protein
MLLTYYAKKMPRLFGKAHSPSTGHTYFPKHLRCTLASISFPYLLLWRDSSRRDRVEVPYMLVFPLNLERLTNGVRGEDTL